MNKTSKRGRRARTPVPVKIISLKLTPEQHELLMQKGREMGYSASSLVAAAVLDRWDLGADAINRSLPPTNGFVQITPGHLVKYEEHGDVAAMLNRLKACKCQFCNQVMELVDIRARYDQWDDSEKHVYKSYEVYYECGNGECNTGTRTMIEVPAHE